MSSYFDTIQGYMNNNNENAEHIKEVADSFAEGKAATLKEKFDSVNGDIEKWGGALQGASTGWWMGRKIIRKIRSYTPDEKPTGQGGETDFSPEEAAKLDDVGKGAVRFADKPEFDPENPFSSSKPSADAGAEPEVPKATGGEAPKNVEPDRISAEPAEEATEASAETGGEAGEGIAGSIARSQQSLANTQATLQKIKDLGNPESANNPAEDPARGNTAEAKPNAEPEGTSGNDADALNETKSVANETEAATNNLAEQGGKEAVEQGTKAAVEQVAEKTGVKTGLDIAGETLADSIPVVGEFVAVGTLIAGLFRDLFRKHHEKVEEEQSTAQAESAGITQTAGIDVSAVASRAGAVAGLV